MNTGQKIALGIVFALAGLYYSIRTTLPIALVNPSTGYVPRTKPRISGLG